MTINYGVVPVEHLSYSSISTYLMCPRSWRYRYIDWVPVPVSPALVFGSAFHDAIEKYLTATNGLTLVQAWRLSWNAQIEKQQEIAWDKPVGKYAELGESMLSEPEIAQVIDAIKPRKAGKRMLVEEKVQLTVPGVPVPIIGFVDVIEKDGIPADFKTSSRAWPQNRAAEELQPVFYLAALNQTGSRLNPDLRFRHYVFVKNAKKPQVQIWETQRTAAELFWLFRLIREVWQAIEGGAFPPNPLTWKCSERWCEYYHLCRGGSA